MQSNQIVSTIQLIADGFIFIFFIVVFVSSVMEATRTRTHYVSQNKREPYLDVERRTDYQPTDSLLQVLYV